MLSRSNVPSMPPPFAGRRSRISRGSRRCWLRRPVPSSQSRYNVQRWRAPMSTSTHLVQPECPRHRHQYRQISSSPVVCLFSAFVIYCNSFLRVRLYYKNIPVLEALAVHVYASSIPFYLKTRSILTTREGRYLTTLACTSIVWRCLDQRRKVLNREK